MEKRHCFRTTDAKKPNNSEHVFSLAPCLPSFTHFQHVTFFSCLRVCNNLSHDVGSSVCARHIIHVSCACFFISLRPSLRTLHFCLSLIFYFILLIFYFILHVDRFGARSPVHFASSSDTRPPYLHDTEISDDTIGRALSSPLFTRSEKNQRAVDKLITLLKKVCCQVSRCLSVM